jgi:WhiB family redox-sensing transcriptional regulator
MTPRTARGRYTRRAHNTSTADPSGHHRALCRTRLDLHFPLGAGQQRVDQTAEAKAMCRQCPLSAACLRWSLDNREPYGVWGGVCEDERAAILRGRHHIGDAPLREAVRDVRVDRAAETERIRSLAAVGDSDEQIATRLGEPWTRGKVADARNAAGIPAGRYARTMQAGRVA